MSARSEGRKGASIHFLRPRARYPDAQGIHFVFRIDNHRHILRAYGSEVARSAVGELNRFLADFFGDDGLVVPELDGRLEVLLWNRALLGALPLESACEAWIHSFCAAVAMVPIECEGQLLHLAVSGAWAGAEMDGYEGLDALASCAQRTLERIRFPGEAPGHGDVWSARYRDDMAAAAEVFSAIGTGQLASGLAAIENQPGFGQPRREGRQVALAWQAVRSAGDVSGILYHECLIRLIDSEGNIHPPSGLLTALERLGLVRALDHYILSAVITELENNPGVTLGANISAQSAQLDGWWQGIEQRLAGDRSLAKRLVIEITETTAMPSISVATAFTSRMRSLGCMIALDDFGAGFTSIRQLLALKPDIAKIDRLFIARAGQSVEERAAFVHLVGLACALVPIVIVEGVENDEQSQLAFEAGGGWQQGYLHDRPSLTRSWRWASEDAASAPWSRFNEPPAKSAIAGRPS